jgi:phytoene/squalene synthetase
MSSASSFDGYLAKWRQYEPEMEFAEPFVPAALRARFRAWGALLHEIDASLFSPSDAQVASRRLGWWAEQLHDPQPQHPLALELRAAGIDGHLAANVAAAALALAHSDEAPAGTTEAVQLLHPYARAIAQAEQASFATSADVADGTTVVAIGMLVRWAPQLHVRPLLRERLPLHLLARHGIDAGPGTARAIARDLAIELRSSVPPGRGLPLYRAMRWSLDRVRLQRQAGGRIPEPGQAVPSPLRATWAAWSAARTAAPWRSADRR